MHVYHLHKAFQAVFCPVVHVRIHVGEYRLYLYWHYGAVLECRHYAVLAASTFLVFTGLGSKVDSSFRFRSVHAVALGCQTYSCRFYVIWLKKFVFMSVATIPHLVPVFQRQ